MDHSSDITVSPAARLNRRRTSSAVGALLICLALVFSLSACKKSNSTASATNGALTNPTATATASECPTSNTVAFAKTKFVLHVGLAAGTFHHWIYAPFKAGTFASGAHGRILALVKAGGTALFDVHELVKAADDVKASPLLCKIIIGPIDALENEFNTLKGKITGGDASSVASINSTVSSLESTAASQGAPITESTNESLG